MNLKSVGANRLHDRIERGIAKFAMRAALDATFGGAKALVYLKRAKRSPHYREYENAVNASYASSNPPTRDYAVYECPECGQARLGAEAAFACCSPTDYDCEE